MIWATFPAIDLSYTGLSVGPQACRLVAANEACKPVAPARRTSDLLERWPDMKPDINSCTRSIKTYRSSDFWELDPFGVPRLVGCYQHWYRTKISESFTELPDGHDGLVTPKICEDNSLSNGYSKLRVNVYIKTKAYNPDRCFPVFVSLYCEAENKSEGSQLLF